MPTGGHALQWEWNEGADTFARRDGPEAGWQALPTATPAHVVREVLASLAERNRRTLRDVRQAFLDELGQDGRPSA
jgi:hypothetical protein